jgi:protein TonB
MRALAPLLSFCLHLAVLLSIDTTPTAEMPMRRALEVELVPRTEARRAPATLAAPAAPRRGIARHVTSALKTVMPSASELPPAGDGAPAGVPDGGAGPGLVVGSGSWSSSGAEPTRQRGEDRPAQVLFLPPIEYPTEAREDGVEGVVVLSVVLDADGTSRSIELLSDPGSGLGDAAREALLRARFAPAVQDGRAVESRFEYRYRFELK